MIFYFISAPLAESENDSDKDSQDDDKDETDGGKDDKKDNKDNNDEDKRKKRCAAAADDEVRLIRFKSDCASSNGESRKSKRGILKRSK